MPLTILSASITISTFIIKRKIPRVRIVIGKVRKIRIGLSIALRNARINEKIRAVL